MPGEIRIKEQEDIINSAGVNMLVSASAGSGKTTVMIKRIVELIISNKVNVKQLLVLTYTKAAAEEMKQKLLDKMQENISLNASLAEQIEEVINCDISTFDSFCQKLVKRYFYAINIDPSFELLQGSNEQEIKENALTNAIEEFKNTNGQDYLYLLNMYASNRTDKNIREIVKKIHVFCSSVLDKSCFYSNCHNLFKDNKDCLASKIVFSSFMNNIRYIKDSFDRLIKDCKQSGYDIYVEIINLILSEIDKLFACKDMGMLVGTLKQFSNVSLVGKKKYDNDVCDYYSQIAKLKNELKDRVDKLDCFGDENDYMLSLEDCKKSVDLLILLNDLYEKKYKQIKNRKNYLDYNDIERCVIELFKNEVILNAIKKQYKYIFIDEYQDANYVQEKIISSLASENNLFYVGDLKQAIYGFRNSVPQIFADKENLFSKQNNSANFYLNCNFRSNKNILDFCNLVFNKIMTKETCGIDYTKSNFDAKAPYKPEPDTNVCLDIIYSGKKVEEKEKSDKIEIYSVKNHIQEEDVEQTAKIEARHVAEKINKIKLTKIYDLKKEIYRDVCYRDITILLRKRGSYQDVFVKELERLHIPVIVNSNQVLEQTYDANVLINLIKASQNKTNDIALTSIMLSYLFNFTCEELSLIRINYESEFFFEAVEKYRINNDIVAQKINNMFQILEIFYQNAKYNGLCFALNQIIVETEYLIKLSQEYAGEIRKQNVINYVNSFCESEFNYDICSYINFLDSNKREEKVMSSGESDDVINITTMHSSKGLEYPIVFICNLGDDFNKSVDNQTEIVLNEKYGIGVKYYNKETRTKYSSVFYEALKLKNKQDEFSEKLRLLYVAFTRAKNRLYLVGTTKKLEFNFTNNGNSINRYSSYLDLIVSSFGKKDIEKINNGQNELYLSEGTEGNKDNFKFLVNIVEPNAETKEDIEKTLVAINKVDEKKAEELAKFMSKPYHNINATLIAQKNSVSSILRDENESSTNYNYAPNKMLICEHLSEKKNEIGSCYHKIFELVDFENINVINIKNIISKIENMKLFDSSITKNIDARLIIKNAEVLRELVNKCDVKKEQKFMMQVPYKNIENSEIAEKVLVQGVCDLLIFNTDGIIIVDYKLSNLNESSLIKKYSKQLELYKMAIELAYNKKVKMCYILDIKTGKLINA